MFFELRGIDVEKFVSVTLQSKVEVMLEHAADVQSERVIDEGRVYSVFGF